MLSIRTLEIIGLIGSVLEANGWIQFKIGIVKVNIYHFSLKELSTKNVMPIYRN